MDDFILVQDSHGDTGGPRNSTNLDDGRSECREPLYYLVHFAGCVKGFLMAVEDSREREMPKDDTCCSSLGTLCQISKMSRCGLNMSM